MQATQRKNRLRSYRRELYHPMVSQEQMAIQAKISSKTYGSAERGSRITYNTAQDILAAINQLRKERHLPPVTDDDLGLNYR